MPLLVSSAPVLDAETETELRRVAERMATEGFASPSTVVIVASDLPGGAVEVIPGDGNGTVALFTPAYPAAALASGIAMLHRWRHTWRGGGAWEKWQVARDVSFAEWIYAAGLGVHAAREYAGAAEHEALDVSVGAFHRLRAAERGLQARLDADLDGAGVGLVMRWLVDGAPVAMRRAGDGSRIPDGAGRYLGWRMLAPRVSRVGLLEAAGMAAS